MKQGNTEKVTVSLLLHKFDGCLMMIQFYYRLHKPRSNIISNTITG